MRHAFYMCFNDIADSCPTALQSRDVVDLYLATLAKGDEQLALSIVMNQCVRSQHKSFSALSNRR